MIKNLVASIRAKLLNIAKENKLNLDYIILRYMQEKLLKRLSASEYRENFVLKGGLFFLLFDNLNPRVTKDIDFLGKSIENSEENIKKIFTEIISIEFEDGLNFDKNKITSELIKEDADYEGVRINIICNLGKIRKKIQIDIGYGDKVYPNIRYENFPSLLDENINDIAVYSIETVISEKFEAMLKLSYINSRMKDFYDIYNIITSYNINGEVVKEAIRKTLENRKTELESNPVIFKEDFYNDFEKNRQWKSFIKRINVNEIEFVVVIDLLKKFLGYIIELLKENKETEMKWNYIKLDWKL